MTDEITTVQTTEFELHEGRILRGLVTPFGETGQNAAGQFVFSAGTIELPTDPSSVTLKLAHDGAGAKVLLGKASALRETDKGIEADFAINAGTVGDRLLEDYAAGKKHSLSAEFLGVVREGINVTKAKLTGAATVVLGGFPSAAFFEATGDEATDSQVTKDLLEDAKNLLTAIQATQGSTTTTNESEFSMTVPNTVATGTAVADKPITKDEVFSLYNAVVAGSATDEMLTRLNSASGFTRGEAQLFALNDVKYDAGTSVQTDSRNPAWVGELWSGRSFIQTILPLFTHGDLTGKTVKGWRWVTKPAGGDWGGNKSNVNSNTPTTELGTATAGFFSMGHDIAIEHQIFDDGFIPAYLEASVDAYAAWADAKVLADVITASHEINADNPAGLSIGIGWSALIDGAVEVVSNNALPTFAVVPTDLYKSMLKVPAADVLGYLNASLGLEEGTIANFSIRSNPTISEILVGSSSAATVYELPSIVRVQAPDTVKGGIDINTFGAEATLIHKSNALVRVALYA